MNYFFLEDPVVEWDSQDLIWLSSEVMDILQSELENNLKADINNQYVYTYNGTNDYAKVKMNL